MKKYILKNNQSPWLEEIYLRELGYKENGFFVEIGVGHSFVPEWDIYNKTGGLSSSNTGPLAERHSGRTSSFLLSRMSRKT